MRHLRTQKHLRNFGKPLPQDERTIPIPRVQPTYEREIIHDNTETQFEEHTNNTQDNDVENIMTYTDNLLEYFGKEFNIFVALVRKMNQHKENDNESKIKYENAYLDENRDEKKTDFLDDDKIRNFGDEIEALDDDELLELIKYSKNVPIAYQNAKYYNPNIPENYNIRYDPSINKMHVRHNNEWCQMSVPLFIDVIHKNLITELYIRIQKLKQKMCIDNKPKMIYVVLDKQNPSDMNIHVVPV
jgi:hypothetical protein